MKRIVYMFGGLLSCMFLLSSTTWEVKALEEETGVIFYREEADGSDETGGGSESGEGTDNNSAGNASGSMDRPVMEYSGNKLPQTGESEAGSLLLKLTGIILLALTIFMVLRWDGASEYPFKGRKRHRTGAVLAVAGLIIAGRISLPAEAAVLNMQRSAAEITFQPGDEEGLLPTDPDDPGEPEPVDPRPEDPEDPGPEPVGRDGLYLLITPQLDFGAVRISEEDASYYAKAQYLYRWNQDDYVFRPNYLEVADLRGTNAGWKIVVTKTEQFTTAEGNTLDGAQIILRDGRVSSVMDGWKESQVMVFQDIVLNPDEPQVVMYAAKGHGAGRWYGLFGRTEIFRMRILTVKKLPI